MGEQSLRGGGAEQIEALPHGGERRICVLSLLDVVEADDRELPGYVVAGLLQYRDHTERRLVGAGHERGAGQLGFDELLADLFTVELEVVVAPKEQRRI